MRIAYVAVKGMPVGGGVEKVTEELGSRLVQRGHDVIVYSSRDYGTSDGMYKGMRIKTVPSVNTKTLHKLSICFNAIRDIIVNRTADIVHVHAIGPSVFSLLPRLFGIPTIVQTHGVEWKRDKWRFWGKTFLKLADLSVVLFPSRGTSVSRVQRDYFRRNFRHELAYIPNGVSETERQEAAWILEQGLLPGRYLLFAARLVEEKGAHFLIEAFRKLDTDMKLVVAGDAAHAEEYKRRLRRLAGDDPRILFPGFVTGDRLAELFSNAWLFCLPSTIEGLPIALLEAMNFGNCCLASDIPENQEALEEHGFTFRSRDVGDLHRMLAFLLAHPEQVTAKKGAALSHVRRHYSWERVTDQMEHLYRSVLSKDECPGGRREAWTEFSR